MSPPTHEQYRAFARKHIANKATITIDDWPDMDTPAPVVRTEGDIEGAWVRAWVWVSGKDAEREATS